MAALLPGRRRGLTGALRPTGLSVVFAVFVLLQNALAQGAAPESLTPQEWRAGVISKLPAYIGWPAEKLGSETNAIRLGVLQFEDDDDAVVGLLSALLKETRVDGRPVVVSPVSRAADAASYHLLFVPQEANARWWEAAAGLNLHGTVTIGDSNDFLRRGGVFNLRTSSRKLEIDRRNASRAGLTVSSKLLRIAHVQ